MRIKVGKDGKRINIVAEGTADDSRQGGIDSEGWSWSIVFQIANSCAT